MLKKFIKEQLDVKSKELDIAGENLYTFQKEEMIYSMDTNTQLIIEELISLEASLYKIVATSNILSERKKYYEIVCSNTSTFI